MATKALARPSRAIRPGRPWAPALTIDLGLMLIAALITRWWWFGNPVVQVDEQYYLVVGDRLLHGWWPFVDVWDRKPIGLFLIYAGARALGGLGILQYQLVATAFTAVSALLVQRIARLFASAPAAWTAGLVALLWTIIFDGEGGQSPVFYNPMVAGAALIVLRAILDRRRGTALTGAGAGAMLLLGLAMQVKYTVACEGVGFGLMLVWQAWRAGERLPTILGQAALWVAVAVAPTLLVWAIYAAHGYGGQFLYANFLSIGTRAPTSWDRMAGRLLLIAFHGAPLIVAAAIGLSRKQQGEGETVRRFLLAWGLAALAGFASIGTFYEHYSLPLVAPLAIALAPALDGRGRFRGQFLWAHALLLALIGVALAVNVSIHRFHKRGDARQFDVLAQAIAARPGCLYVYDGEPMLYELFPRCRPTRFLFPSHLNDWKETHSIGADQAAELARVIAAKPRLIVTSDVPNKESNLFNWIRMRDELAREYRPVVSVHFRDRGRVLYERKPTV
jgi:4-amino-4-deoxy-L-arabinose transferase-like glycosyltransferase